MDPNNRLHFLLQQYKNNHASPEELEALRDLLNDPSFEKGAIQWLEQRLYESPETIGYSEERLHAILASIRSGEPFIPAKKVHFMRRYGWAAAAVVLAMAGLMQYWFRAEVSPKIAVSPPAVDIAPGHSGAVLHLSDGSTVVLDSAQNGTVAILGKVQVVKEDGTLKYTGSTNEKIYHTVSTNKGRQWQMTLADGTKVWLNAASSIRYPLSFTGNERSVEITGEVYFEVTHNEARPFKVKARGQVIEDLGTIFNVNAYADEDALRTTLLEGAVRIGGVTLKPGEQGAIKNGSLKVSPVNTEQVVAWKNGFFSFKKTPLKEVMLQLARWYDVEVAYEGNIPDMKFGGKINRNSNASQVLTILEESNIHFKIQGKKIIVMP